MPAELRAEIHCVEHEGFAPVCEHFHQDLYFAVGLRVWTADVEPDFAAAGAVLRQFAGVGRVNDGVNLVV